MTQYAFPLRLPAIAVRQPLGIFFVTKIPADVLLRLTYADPLRVTSEAFVDDRYPMTGAQRSENRRRLKAIARYIETAEAAFPNSIILGANYTKEGELVEDENRRWAINSNDGDGCLELIIPTGESLASVIDGQHRLNAFEHVEDSLASDTELLCAIYLDLPDPYQAALFATINFNQKKVDRSLAYLLIGKDFEDEEPMDWAPDKAAVFLSRKLNLDEQSPLHQNIIVAAQYSERLFRNRKGEWSVSTATIVDGILRLFSTNPTSDKEVMHRKRIEDGRSRTDLGEDGSPLRNLYIKGKDAAIYTILFDYFWAVRDLFWEDEESKAVMTKTVALQALFDILRLLLLRMRETDERDFSRDHFRQILEPASVIDFASLFESSSRGRTSIRVYIGLSLGLISLQDVRNNKDYAAYEEFHTQLEK